MKEVIFMKDKKHVEFRYYDIPQGDIVFPLTGQTWNKEYGEGRERLHFHNYYEVGLCHDGEGEMILGDRQLRFRPGCISIIPTKELHTTNTFGKKAHWEWMYFDIHEVLKDLYPDDEILRENMSYEIDKEGKLLFPENNIQKMAFLIKGIFSELQNKEYLYRDMTAHYLKMLVVEIIRKLQNTGMPERVSSTVNIFPSIDYIKKNYGSAVRVKDLARSCGMSESYFRKVFEKYMNMKPMDYVNFVRIQKGCALLRETDLAVSVISDKIGYESVSSFIRNFSRVIGCTPNKWRTDEKYINNKLTNYNVTALKGWLE